MDGDALLNELFGFESADADVGECEEEHQNIDLPSVNVRSIRSGERGVFASSSIPAATLIVAEVPTITYAPTDFEESELPNIVKRICLDPVCYAVTQHLHPRSIIYADEEEIARAKSLLGESLKCISNNLAEDEIIRVFLTLQHNGFGSGMYSILSMFNHSCSPNCIKYETSKLSKASEIWTTRTVHAGEELTICYIEPREQTRNAVRMYLQLHHRFTCYCDCCSDSEKEEEADEVEELDMLQNRLENIETEILWLKLENDIEILKILRQLLNNAVSVQDKLMASTVKSFSKHHLLMRSHKVLVKVSSMALEISSSLTGTKQLKESYIAMNARTYLESSLALQSMQRSYLGSDHPDLATSSFDIANSIKFLLSIGQSELIVAALPSSGSSPKRVIFDTLYFHQAEGKRIRDMFLTRSRYKPANICLRKAGDCFFGVHLSHEANE